ncbi:hypothetical protein OU798_18030 [Prolixibacteraceae bacterium Z1-6]|uniref:Bacterial surface antigen (D15) domain-containing protein n=1 Tax=Draconibacterium aestuarii TaxID=2998507 RepID=A0A9X3FGI4_9BACT|nr:hypothetical protein [Prolixibacteraceae bacterium Z1-6]
MKKLLFLVLLFIGVISNAQYFQTGQDPASLKWRQINTENFQLIYPNYFEDQAQVLAGKLEVVYNYGGYSLGYKPEKISVILHTQTVQSNGLVAYAPKRSEFYTTPHQANYPQDWLEQLAIHEFRHIVQIDKLNEELPKILKMLLGEQGTALVFGAYLPWWFIEGDAVVSETVLGNYGRGRFPSFLVEHRAQVVEKGTYSYDKAYLGSYKNYVPNHYRLGYYMVANTRERYGSKMWESVVTRVGEKPFSITPFNKALKLETGMNKVQLYNSVFDSLANAWKIEDQNFISAPSKNITSKHKTFTSYRYNHWLNSNAIITYKTALNRIPAFVMIDKNGNEKILIQPGTIFDESVNYHADWIVWAERIPDLRWSHSGLSLIHLLNVSNKKQLSFYPELKAFAPSLSENLDKVVVVESDFSNNYFLSVYRISDGKLLHRIQTPENNYFFSPEWISDKEVAAIILTGQGKRLAKIDLENGDFEILHNQDLGELKHLRFKNNRLYFICGYSGKNALYSYNFESKKIDQLYEPRFGVEYPSINANNTFVLSDYTADGFRLIEHKPENAKTLELVNKEEYGMLNRLTIQEPGIIDFSNVDTTKFSSTEYRKSSNLFNFHSWAPLFVDVNSYEFAPGVSVMSQNKLGTAETVLGYKWDTSEETGQFYANYIYKGWYPVLDFEISKGKRASNYWLVTEHTRNQEEVESDTTLERYTWKATKISADISLPLNFSRGAYYRLLQPEVKYEMNLYQNDDSTPDIFPDGNYHSFTYRLYYHQLLRQSYQDVYPNFGFIFNFDYMHSPNGYKGLGTLKAAQSYIYLPGIAPNHGVKLYGGIQEKERGETFRFSDAISFPRGWGRTETNKLNSYAANYKFPLLNPDFSLGGLAYVRRINATLFADYATLWGNIYDNGKIVDTYKTNISSYGLELVGDVNFLRFYAPAKIGVRTSYIAKTEDVAYEFLLSIDFTSL